MCLQTAEYTRRKNSMGSTEKEIIKNAEELINSQRWGKLQIIKFQCKEMQKKTYQLLKAKLIILHINFFFYFHFGHRTTE